MNGVYLFGQVSTLSDSIFEYNILGRNVYSSDTEGTMIVICDCSDRLCLAESSLYISKIRNHSPHSHIFLLLLNVKSSIFSSHKIERFTIDYNVSIYRPVIHNSSIQELCDSLDTGRFYCVY